MHILGQNQLAPVADPVVDALRTIINMIHGEGPWTQHQYAVAESVLARVSRRRHMTPSDFNQLYRAMRSSVWSPFKI